MNDERLQVGAYFALRGELWQVIESGSGSVVAENARTMAVERFPAPLVLSDGRLVRGGAPLASSQAA